MTKLLSSQGTYEIESKASHICRARESNDVIYTVSYAKLFTAYLMTIKVNPSLGRWQLVGDLPGSPFMTCEDDERANFVNFLNKNARKSLSKTCSLNVVFKEVCLLVEEKDKSLFRFAD